MKKFYVTVEITTTATATNSFFIEANDEDELEDLIQEMGPDDDIFAIDNDEYVLDLDNAQVEITKVEYEDGETDEEYTREQIQNRKDDAAADDLKNVRLGIYDESLAALLTKVNKK